MKDDDWASLLTDHPIFSLPKIVTRYTGNVEDTLELSTSTLPGFKCIDPRDDCPTPSGRRQVMVLKNEDLIVAAGKELRMTCLGDYKMGRSIKKSYKVLHTPNIEFEIHQLALNPSGKLLAVAGAFQVAVVVLPRTGYSRLVPTTIDCKSIQVGQFYHASDASGPVVKIEWHPWGEAGSTLLVMTIDGKLREYDISIDTEEPQQVLSFVPEKKTRSYLAEDISEREVASFTLGRGNADWGPLTVYAVMRSGDVYCFCPYMPRNASIPSSYINALDTFTNAKIDFLSHSQDKHLAAKAHSTLYNHQSLYIKALSNQLPHDLVLGTTSRSVLMHPPSTTQTGGPHNKVLRQGPFLLQPSPRMLDTGDGGDATDIVYLAFGGDEEDIGEGETERLGVVLITYQDGRVDVCLDVEKVEARWETKTDSSQDLPMFAVYETIDLGIVSTLEGSSELNDPALLDLLQGNHPVFLSDPIHDDTVYVYHAFGVHALYLGPMLQTLGAALRTEDDEEGTELKGALNKCATTNVHPVLTTFSVERKCSNPIIAVVVPNDVYLTYSIFILTSAWRICPFPLNLRSEDLPAAEASIDLGTPVMPVEGSPAYISLLSHEPFVIPPILSRPSGLPSKPRLAIGSPNSGQESMLTPDSLRYLANIVGSLSNEIHDVMLAHQMAEARAMLQIQEFQQQQDKSQEIVNILNQLKNQKHDRVKRVMDKQKMLLARSDRILQALVEKASPELSEHEKKWFEELRRMKDEVAGGGRSDEWSLAARTRLLQREYQRLLPSLKELLRQETERQKKLAENNQGLGISQAFELGERSSRERERISAIERDVLKLAAKLELSVGRPPNSKDNDSP